MIVEPAMMNCGVILPEPGYLQGLKDLCHANGAYLAFDEVKTGATLAYGGATEVVRRRARHHLPGQGDRRRHAVRRDRRDRELYGPVIDGEYDMAGTFNGNPLTMAAIARDPDRGADARRVRRTSTASTRRCRTASPR